VFAIAIEKESPQFLGSYFGGNGSDQWKLASDVQNTTQNRGLAMESAAIRSKKKRPNCLERLLF
jgi:hypothetical protein